MTATTPGVLLLYFKTLYGPWAQNIWDNLNAYTRHSRFPVFPVNTALPFPAALRELRFDAVLFHYSLFGLGYHYEISPPFQEWLENDRESLRLASFQDEFRWCGKRFRFIDDYRVDTVYTLAPGESAHGGIYRERTRARHVFPFLTAHVSDQLLDAAQRHAMTDDQRPIDVGYRARKLSWCFGRASWDKYEIGPRFREACRERGLDLRLDLSEDEFKRLHGEAWWRFLGSSKGTLGVESGTSIFDVDDAILEPCEAYLRAHPEADFETVWRALLAPHEHRVPYLFLAPRNFEAAAFRVCQILQEGAYSGLMRPGEHYLALQRDFSNFDEVIAQFQDPARRRQLTENAHRDLIASGRHTYARFVAAFDDHLERLGMQPDPDFDPQPVRRALARRDPARVAAAHLRDLHFARFPGKGVLRWLWRLRGS